MRFDDVLSQLKALEDKLYGGREIRRLLSDQELVRNLGTLGELQALADQTEFARAAEIAAGGELARAIAALEMDAKLLAAANIGHEARKSIDRYTTIFDLGSKHAEMMDAVTARGRMGHQVDALRALEQSLRVSEPWILRDAPGASLEAFAKLSKLGSFFQETSPSHALFAQVRDLAGEYLSDRAFAAAAHDLTARQRLYEQSGLHDLVAPIAPHAFLDVLWETRVSPTPPPRSTNVDTTPSGVIVIRADDYEARAYLEVRRFEPPLRRVVRVALDSHYGPGWEALLPPALVKRLAKKAAAKPGASQDLLDHTTFHEITGVISHPRFWAEVFEPMLGVSRDEFLESMNRIRRVRNNVAHFEGLLREEFALITLEVGVLAQALGLPREDDSPSDDSDD